MVLLGAWLKRRSGKGENELLSLARVAGLGAIYYGISTELPPGAHDEHLAVLVLSIVAGAAWVGWMAARHFEIPRFTWPSLLVVAVVGGALGALAPVALVFPAVAALGAGVAYDTGPALGIAAIGAAAVLISVPAAGAPTDILATGPISCLAGFLAGSSRRQYQYRAVQAEALLDERVRADAERNRATVLAERNRVAREIHDVLAHSLGALSVQLDALDALLEDRNIDKARKVVLQARSLSVEGLNETRQAVHALRDEPVELVDQLAALAERDGAELSVHGSHYPLSAEAGVALYRAAQEAVTNARKHAPGAPVSICLQFGDVATRLTVTNGTTEQRGDLGGTGGGYGLQGMRERIELLGGEVAADHIESGFEVQVVVPR